MPLLDDTDIWAITTEVHELLTSIKALVSTVLKNTEVRGGVSGDNAAEVPQMNFCNLVYTYVSFFDICYQKKQFLL